MKVCTSTSSHLTDELRKEYGKCPEEDPCGFVLIFPTTVTRMFRGPILVDEGYPEAWKKDSAVPFLRDTSCSVVHREKHSQKRLNSNYVRKVVQLPSS